MGCEEAEECVSPHTLDDDAGVRTRTRQVTCQSSKRQQADADEVTRTSVKCRTLLGRLHARCQLTLRSEARVLDSQLAKRLRMLARVLMVELFHSFPQVLTDLVQGEFMQLGSKETENERFAHYFTKTYRKTASLIANSLKAVSVSFPSMKEIQGGIDCSFFSF